MQNYFGILVLFLMAVTVSGLFIVLSECLGPKRMTPEKAVPFECGKTPFELPTGRHSVRFYLAGMLFVLFDVEIIFFFPWAAVFRQVGMSAFISMLFFAGMLELGFLYAWRKGAFEWK